MFVGDDALANVYAGFNILVRENLVLGALKDWEMGSEYRDSCRCESQFTDKSCWPLRITASDQFPSHDDSNACSTCRFSSAHPQHSSLNFEKENNCTDKTVTATPHAFFSSTGSPIAKTAHERFHRLVAQGAGRKKPLPVVHGLSHSTSYSLSTAQASMDEWLAMAKPTGRNTPFLWIGPTAPGHQKKPAEDNTSVWQYAIDTAQAAQSRDMDVLGMYNATLQAESWDGTHFGEKVALTQAMMVSCPIFFSFLFSLCNG